MVLDFTTTFKVYDDVQGKINRQGNLSVHANADDVSMDYIKGAISVLSSSIVEIIEDIEIGGK